MVNLYKEIWSRIGGRPWTFIIRDTWHRYEWFWIVGWAFFGAYLGNQYGMPWMLDRILWLTLGYILGHLFWGTGYVPDQREDAPEVEGK